MKKKELFALPALLGALLFFAACSDDDNDNTNPNPNPDPDVEQTDSTQVDSVRVGTRYVGCLTVLKADNDGTTDYVEADQRVSLAYNELKTACTLTLYDIKFATNMPLRLAEMKVEGILCTTEADGSMLLEADSIVPTNMGIAYNNFTIANLQGTVQGDSLALDFDCTRYSVHYSGCEPVE